MIEGAEFGEQFAECQMEVDGEECGHIVRSMHTMVLAMKFDDHLQEAHDTDLETMMEGVEE